MALGSDELDVGLVNESRGVEDWRVRTPSLHELLARQPAKLGIHQRYQRIECVGVAVAIRNEQFCDSPRLCH